MDFYARSSLVACWNVASAIWVRTAVRKSAPGLHRFAVSLPLIVVNCLMAYIFDFDTERIVHAITAYNLLWMSNIKVIAYCMHRGALTIVEDSPFSHFLFVMSVPLLPKDRRGTKNGNANGKQTSQVNAISFMRLFAKWVLLGFVTRLLARPGEPLMARVFWSGFTMYGFLSLVTDGPTTWAAAAIGLELDKHFDHFWLAKSVADLWARWNIVTANTLRDLAFMPIYEGRFVNDPKMKPRPKSTIRTVVAVVGTFLLSGVLHSIMHLFILERLSLNWFTVFAIQGPCVVVENRVLKWAKSKGFVMPYPLTMYYTVGWYTLNSYWFFSGPALQDPHAVEVIKGVTQFIYLPQSLFIEGPEGGVVGICGYELPVFIVLFTIFGWFTLQWQRAENCAEMKQGKSGKE